MIRMIFLMIIVGGLAALQAWNFSILGIVPDLVMIAIIATSFFIFDIWEEVLLIALGTFILKFTPFLKSELTEFLIFPLILLALIIIGRYLPWYAFLNNLFLIASGTLIFYLLLAGNLILSQLFLKELFLNLILGAIIFAFLINLWENKGLG